MKTDSLILSFDTSAAHCAAALSSNDAVLDSIYEPMEKGQNERLIVLLEDLLTRQNASWSDLDAVAVGVGPGNFTGIRIGISAARGLSLGLDIPAYGINGFEQRKDVLKENGLNCVPAPRDQFFVDLPEGPQLLSQDEAEQLGQPILPDPDPLLLVSAIGNLARAAWPTPPATPPAPLYIKPPDAAPSRDAPPQILDDA
ncbi:MAG: tRNA (adenosine(37)-N6)-threonylcarbamoyltransferase complex dimerization subunit type 1 TsaB [Paracoccaceae bacterium]